MEAIKRERVVEQVVTEKVIEEGGVTLRMSQEDAQKMRALFDLISDKRCDEDVPLVAFAWGTYRALHSDIVPYTDEVGQCYTDWHNLLGKAFG